VAYTEAGPRELKLLLSDGSIPPAAVIARLTLCVFAYERIKKYLFDAEQ